MGRWTYDSFANWEFFPEGWIDQPQGPVLVYFKETQTPEDQWDVSATQRLTLPTPNPPSWSVMTKHMRVTQKHPGPGPWF